MRKVFGTCVLSVYSFLCLSGYAMDDPSGGTLISGERADLAVSEFEISQRLLDSLDGSEVIRRLEEAYVAGTTVLDDCSRALNDCKGKRSKITDLAQKVSVSTEGPNDEVKQLISQQISQLAAELSSLKENYKKCAQSPGLDENTLKQACDILKTGIINTREAQEQTQKLGEIIQGRRQQLAQSQQQQVAALKQASQENVLLAVNIGVWVNIQQTLLNAKVDEGFVALISYVFKNIVEKKTDFPGVNQFVKEITPIVHVMAMAGQKAAEIFAEEVCAILNKAQPVLTLTKPDEENLLIKYNITFSDEAPAIPPQEALRRLLTLAHYSKDESIRSDYMAFWKEIVTKVANKEIGEEIKNESLKIIAESINNSDIPSLKKAIKELVNNPTDVALQYKVKSGKNALHPPEGVEIPALEREYYPSNAIPGHHGLTEQYETTEWKAENPTIDEIIKYHESGVEPNQTSVVCFPQSKLDMVEIPYLVMAPRISSDLERYPAGSSGMWYVTPGSCYLDFRGRAPIGAGEHRVAVPLCRENIDAMYLNSGIKLPFVQKDGNKHEVKYSDYAGSGDSKPWLLSIQQLEERIADMDEAQTQYLSRSQLTALSQECVRALESKQIKGFTDVVIMYLDANKIADIFQHLELWQLLYIEPNAIQCVTWEDWKSKFQNHSNDMKDYLKENLIKCICMRKQGQENAPRIETAIPGAAGTPPPPPPPPGVRTPTTPPAGTSLSANQKDIDALNWCFIYMSPKQIQHISDNHVVFLNLETLSANKKIQHLTVRQIKAWMNDNSEKVVEVVGCLTPVQCACIPQRLISWDMIRNMSESQVFMLSPEQVSSLEIPEISNVDETDRGKLQLLNQKKSIAKLTTGLKRAKQLAEQARQSKHSEILQRYNDCYWGDADTTRNFEMFETIIDMTAETSENMVRTTSSGRGTYRWEDILPYQSIQQKIAMDYLRHTDSFTDIFDTTRLINPVAIQYGQQLAKLKSILATTLKGHVVTGVEESGEFGKAKITSILLEEDNGKEFTLHDYLLMSLKPEDEVEIEAAAKNAETTEKQRALSTVDQKVATFLQTLEWNDGPLSTELMILGLKNSSNCSVKSRTQLRNKLAMKLNEEFLVGDYIFYDSQTGTIYFPPADLRKIYKLSKDRDLFWDGQLTAKMRIVDAGGRQSDERYSFDDACIKGNKDRLVQPSMIELEFPSGENGKTIDVGLKTIRFLSRYFVKDNVPVSMPSLEVFTKFMEECLSKTKVEARSVAANPYMVVARTVKMLDTFLKEYCDYWIQTSTLQRKAMSSVAEDKKAQFEKHWLAEELTNISAVGEDQLKKFATECNDNAELERLLVKAATLYKRNEFSDVTTFAASLRNE